MITWKNIKVKHQTINQYDEYGNYLQTFNSFTDISKIYKVSISQLIRCCKTKVGKVGKYQYRYNKEYEDCKRINTTFSNDKKHKCVVVDNFLFKTIKDCCKYLNITLVGDYLKGTRPMPQRWKNRGLRYYNEETDKDLPIWNEKGDVNE